MKPSLDVFLEHHAAPCGTLSAEGGTLSFRYDAAYLDAEGRAALSVRLPLREGEFDDVATRAFFANLLPEGRALADRARGHEVEEDDVFGLLSAIGAECAGAVSVLRPGAEPVKRPGRFPKDYRPIGDEELAGILEDLAEGRAVAPEGSADPSLAGVQSKTAVLVDDEGRIHAARGSAPTTHILKVAARSFPGGEENEVFCQRLAAALGFEAAEAELREHEGRRFVLVRRYDRPVEVDGRSVGAARPGALIRRLHQEDFAQALGLPPNRKYTHRGGPTLEEVVAAMGETVADPIGFRDAFLSATLLSVLIGNSDAHLKNFSLLHLPAASGGTRLAPLYDLGCIRLYPRLRQGMALSVGGRQDWQEIDAGAWKAFAAEAGYRLPYLRRQAERLSRDLVPAALALRAEAGFTAACAGRIVDAAGDQVRLLARGLGFRFDPGTAPFFDRAGGWGTGS